ncbi:MAG: hypothetical protein IJ469_08280 [Candidatus Methanomethylophilaceae archaeon]|nr:hypothetical protein [Candidatus Methanomethylophilaceae archaeon]
MMVFDSGGLPEDWTMETLLSDHRSVPVNPKLAYAFFLMGYIENWGRGIERIRGGYSDHVGNDVVFEAARSYFQVTLDAITVRPVRAGKLRFPMLRILIGCRV